MKKRYTAVVEDINDPLEANRVRVRVLGVHAEERGQLPTANLPWADITMPPTSAGTSGVGSIHGLLQGSWVTCEFQDDELQAPVITGVVSGHESTAGSILDTKSLSYPLRSGNSLPYEASRRTRELAPSYADKVATRQIDVPTATPTKVTSLVQDKEDSYYEKKPWTAPDPSTYIRPKYPHNKVERSAGGIVREVDSTPGAERLAEFHPSGTHREIIASGDEIIVVRGSKYTTVFADDNVYVKGSVNLTVEGDVRHLVKGNYHLEVDGNYSQDIKGNYDSKVGKSKNEEILQDNGLNVAENDIKNVGIDSTETVANNKTLNVGANVAATIGGDTSITSMGDALLVSPSNVVVASGGKMSVLASSTMKVESGGDMSVKTDGALAVNSASTSMNTGSVSGNLGNFSITVAGGSSITSGSAITISGTVLNM